MNMDSFILMNKHTIWKFLNILYLNTYFIATILRFYQSTLGLALHSHTFVFHEDPLTIKQNSSFGISCVSYTLPPRLNLQYYAIFLLLNLWNKSKIVTPAFCNHGKRMPVPHFKKSFADFADFSESLGGYIIFIILHINWNCWAIRLSS